MSRVGKKPIAIPKGVEVKISAEKMGYQVGVKGSKGSLNVVLPQGVAVEQKDSQLVLSVKNSEDGHEKALWGLSRSLINNAVLGVTGGFSNPVEYPLPDGITAVVDKNNIKISGIDKQLLGQVTAEIRAIKKPEPYKGKGIKYIDEHIRRKAGKVVKAA